MTGKFGLTRFSFLVFALFFLLTQASPLHGEEKKGEVRKPVKITSDRMEADRLGSVVVFKGNVVAEEDFTLHSDELLLQYSDADEIKEIVATGNVRIYQGDKKAESEKAVYDRVQRKIVLTGNPVVTECMDTVRGDRITVFVDTDRALVESESGGRVRAVIMPEKKCEGGARPSSPGGGKHP